MSGFNPYLGTYASATVGSQYPADGSQQYQGSGGQVAGGYAKAVGGGGGGGYGEELGGGYEEQGQQYADPNQQLVDLNQQYADPNQQYADPSQYAADPSQYAADPSQYAANPSLSPAVGEYYESHRFTPHLRNAPVESLAFDAAPFYVAPASLTIDDTSNPPSPAPAELLFAGSSLASVRTTTPTASHSHSANFLKQCMLASIHMPSCTTYGACVGALPPPPALATLLTSALKGDPIAYYDPATPIPPPTSPYHKDVPNTTGITCLLPCPPMLLSVSPTAVKAHTPGMMLLAENGGEEVLGATTGCFNPPYSSYTGGARNLTHVTVGGPTSPTLTMLDIYAGLTKAATVDVGTGVAGLACATGAESAFLVVGACDGQVHLVDGHMRSNRRRYEQKVTAHSGAVRAVAASDDGNFFATVGYVNGGGGRCFGDHHVCVFDARMIGRRPVQIQFAGGGGMPSFLQFLPEQQSPTLVVASGKQNGGVQIMEPYGDPNYSSFLTPSLEQGEAMTCLAISPSSNLLAVGTSHGKVVMFEKAGYPRTVLKVAQGESPAALFTPSFPPVAPPVSIDPSMLLRSSGNVDNPFNMVGMVVGGSVSGCEAGGFGALGESCVVGAGNTRIFCEKMEQKLAAFGQQNEFVNHLRADAIVGSKTITTALNHNQLIFNEELSGCVYDAKADPRKRALKKQIEPNPTIPTRYRLMTRPTGGNAKQFDFTYTNHNDTGKYAGWDAGNNTPNAYAAPVLVMLYFIPEIRASLLREQFQHRIFEEESGRKKKFGEKGGTNFSAPKVGALSAELGFLFHQMDSLSNFALTTPDKDIGAWQPSNFFATFSLLPEAAALALLDSSSTAVKLPRRIEAFYRFLVLHLNQELVPEVDGMRVVDSLQSFNMESVNHFVTGDANAEPTRHSTKALTIELNYDRFVGRKVSEELKNKGYFADVLSDTLARETRLRAWCEETRAYETVVQKKGIGSLPGILAIQCSCAGGGDGTIMWRGKNAAGGVWLPSIVEIECADESVTVAEKTGVDSWYKSETGEKAKEKPGKVARSVSIDSTHSNVSNGSVYSEHVPKRRFEVIAVCSYVKNDEETDGHHVVHVKVPKAYVARVLQRQGDEAEHAAEEVDSERFKSRKPSKPEAVEAVTLNMAKMEFTEGNEAASEAEREKKTIEEALKAVNMSNASRLSPRDLAERIADVRKKSAEFVTEGEKEEEEWVLFNGFVVTKEADVTDVLDFSSSWKEPCLVLYRSIDEAPLLPSPVSSPTYSTLKKQGGKGGKKKKIGKEAFIMSPEMLKAAGVSESDLSIPLTVMNANSINDGDSVMTFADFSEIPGKGDICAIDTEFVSVQNEDSVLTENGGKIVTMDARSALARISVIDCRSGRVIIDDYVLPQEPVVDYLTRFSGITSNDLDPLVSPRHLVNTRTAYLKLRLLIDRGVIMVGHGLKTDFNIVNVFCPPAQIIDTVVIFYQTRARMIGLRFLVNYLFGHDMQTDTHDSIEDARAAWEVYKKAVALKAADEFDLTLTKIYEFGRKTEWKLGVAVQERDGGRKLEGDR